MNKNQLRAIKIACQIMRDLPLKAGLTEKQLAAWIALQMKNNGVEPSFPTIIASGARSVDPHAKPTNNAMKNGEQVVVDLGVKYKGYCSDITRTFFLGKPTAKFTHLYSLVKAAQAKAIKVVKAGVYCREVDITAREHIKRACFHQCHLSLKKCGGDCFIHTTGHGVGRRIHQEPRISMKSRKKLAAGMVITIEPGIYVKGWGGIRIEDMVLVTKEGCKVLTGTCG
ncbi:MAG: M24 family metallopeptidase [bacterium]